VVDPALAPAVAKVTRSRRADHAREGKSSSAVPARRRRRHLQWLAVTAPLLLAAVVLVVVTGWAWWNGPSDRTAQAVAQPAEPARQAPEHLAVRLLRGHTAQVEGVAFSPDGSWALSASHDHILCLWEIPRGRECVGGGLALAPRVYHRAGTAYMPGFLIPQIGIVTLSSCM
jgi:hypothetical protein